ncbi:MAG: hypothetical protein H7Z17_06425 [Fuerstia sp.]|nr:hypothetical protein [Fuerstiella sp.]
MVNLPEKRLGNHTFDPDYPFFVAWAIAFSKIFRGILRPSQLPGITGHRACHNSPAFWGTAAPAANVISKQFHRELPESIVAHDPG